MLVASVLVASVLVATELVASVLVASVLSSNMGMLSACDHMSESDMPNSDDMASNSDPDVLTLGKLLKAGCSGGVPTEGRERDRN